MAWEGELRVKVIKKGIILAPMTIPISMEIQDYSCCTEVQIVASTTVYLIISYRRQEKGQGTHIHLYEQMPFHRTARTIFRTRDGVLYSRIGKFGWKVVGPSQDSLMWCVGTGFQKESSQILLCPFTAFFIFPIRSSILNVLWSIRGGCSVCW